jgi:hypothetical protein
VLVTTSAVGCRCSGALRSPAHTLGSVHTRRGTQNLLCGYLALAVLAGLPETPSLAGGGSTRSLRSRSPRSRFARASTAGAARVALRDVLTAWSRRQRLPGHSPDSQSS